MPDSLLSILKKNETLLLYIFIVLLSYFSLFQFLDRMVLQMWDESENAVNAIEMIQRNSWLVKYFNGEPDMFETKPPFFVWHIILFMKVFGINEFAVRITSPLYVLGSIFLLLSFSQTFFRNKYAGVVASVVMLSSYGVASRHYGRTGDTDATLVFYVFLSFISYFRFLHVDRHKSKYFLIFILSLFLAFFSKSVVGFVFLPGMFIYTIYSKKLKYLLSFWPIYPAAFVFIALGASYYIYHEMLTPGYWNVVSGGEFGATGKGQDTFGWYYFTNLWESRFSKWVIFFPISMLVSVAYGTVKERAYTFYTIFSVMVFLFFLSKGMKNLWYDAPLYPLMSLSIGLGVITVYKQIGKFNYGHVLRPIFILSMFVYSSFAYLKIARNSFMPDYAYCHWTIYDQSFLLRDKIMSDEPVGNLKLVHNLYPSEVIFYKYWANSKPGNNVSLADINDISVGDTILTSIDELKVQIDSMFNVEVIESWRKASIFVIQAEKEY